MQSIITCESGFAGYYSKEGITVDEKLLLNDIPTVNLSVECRPLKDMSCEIKPVMKKNNYVKKKVSFAKKGRIRYFNENIESKKCAKYYLPPSTTEREVSEIQAKLNLWSDSEQDRNLYHTNTEINCISPEVQDFRERDENLFNLVESITIAELRLKYWYKRGPKPLRNLLGIILCSGNAKKDLETLQTKTISELIWVTTKMIERLQNGNKKSYCLYEVSAHITRKNIPLMVSRIKMMEDIIENRK